MFVPHVNQSGQDAIVGSVEARAYVRETAVAQVGDESRETEPQFLMVQNTAVAAAVRPESIAGWRS